MGGTGFLAGGAPSPDPERVAMIRYTIVDEPETCAAFAEPIRAALGDLLARMHAEIRAGDLGDCSDLLSRILDRIVALDPSRLEPRRRLAGLFDSRAKRLKACRAAYASAADAAGEAAGRLGDQGSVIAKKHDTLEGLWIQTRDAVCDLDAHVVAARDWLASQPPAATVSPPELEASDAQAATAIAPHPLDLRLATLMDLRSQAIQSLPIIRAVQNTDHSAPATLRSASGAIETWRGDWQRALGLSGKKTRKVRPDIAQLSDAQTALADHLAATGRDVQAIQDRRVELQARSTNAAGSIR